ncbi:MAG: hypothetical protein ACQEVA_10415 [Myxococcota bacterium]
MRRPIMKPHDRPESSKRAWFGALWCLVALVCWSSPALGQDDGVLVTFHGGTDRADAFDLIEDNGDVTVSEQGQLTLLGDEFGLEVISDFKLLPNGSNLLAGVGGRGVVITDSGAETEFIFGPEDSMPRSSSASVMVYAAPGEPGRILLTDSNTSQLLVFEPEDRQLVWQSGFSLSGSNGLFADAIAMPNSRVVAGIEYTSLGLSALDVIEFTPGPTGTTLRRITNREHANGPSSQVEVPGLHPLRDILGLPNGHILAATDERLYEIDLEGNVQWMTQIIGRSGIQGDISSVALMPSGRIAVSTLEAGQWTRPHPNHRVHWLARGALASGEVDVVATSPSLRRAPSGLETKGGHGGSGTFGYRPGLDRQAEGQLADLSVARPLDFARSEYTLRDSVAGSILVRNDGDQPLYLSQIQVRAVAGECDATSEDSPVPLFDSRFVELAPGGLFDLRGTLEIEDQLTLGRWCAQTYATDGEGNSAEVGAPAYFEVVEESADGGRVVVRDVGFWEADAFDAGRGANDPVDPPGGGCCSHTVHDESPVDLAFAFGLLAVGAVLVRRY